MLLGISGGIWRACTDGSSPTDRLAPLALTSSGPRPTSLDELVETSAVVVIGRAISVAPGRMFGGSRAGIRSQVVTLEVGRVLAGGDPGPMIAMEEEVSTADGRRIVIDGLRPTEAGDQGIFFLVRGADADVPYLATVSTAGRFLRTSVAPGSDELLGADDPLARQLADLGGSVLTDRVLALNGSPDMTD